VQLGGKCVRRTTDSRGWCVASQKSELPVIEEENNADGAVLERREVRVDLLVCATW